MIWYTMLPQCSYGPMYTVDWSVPHSVTEVRLPKRVGECCLTARACGVGSTSIHRMVWVCFSDVMTSVGHHDGVVTRVYTPDKQHKGYVTVTPSEANSLNGLVWVCNAEDAPAVTRAMRLIITHDSLVVMARIVACDMPVPDSTIHCGTPFSCNQEDTLSLHVDNVVYSVPGVECDIRLDTKTVLGTTVVVRAGKDVLNRENMFPTQGMYTTTCVITNNNNGLYDMMCSAFQTTKVRYGHFACRS
ncbi:ORF4L [Turbot reddish body iridovirus]|uniref:ORF4L n=1 Tax=Turbot reddish body iridovirus TaxID=273651 RepID=E2CTU9_ISKNV|nr:ORF4L [Turbot reddish body iridovirus]